jgi:hypothetical protein
MRFSEQNLRQKPLRPELFDPFPNSAYLRPAFHNSIPYPIGYVASPRLAYLSRPLSVCICSLDNDNDNMSSRPRRTAGTFPSAPVAALREAHQELIPSPESIPVTIAAGRQDIVTNLILLGYFPTVKWKDDPMMPEFCAYHKFRIGYYQVANCDLCDASGNVMQLTVVVNVGDGDCNSGYWGGVFQRYAPHDCIAQFESSGDTETTTRQQQQQQQEGVSNDVPAVVFVEYEGLRFPKFQGDQEDEIDYFSCLSPGICETQLEKILAVTMDRMMDATQHWNTLPKELKDAGDRY